MANTIESTTDAELTRSLLDGSIEGTFEDDTITILTRDGLFCGCNALTDVILSNITSMSGYSFVPSSSSASSCTSLKTIDVPNLTKLTSELWRLPTLENFNAPNLTNLANNSSYVLRYCDSIKKIHLPKLTLCNFYGNNALKYVVLPNVINVRAVRGTHGGFIALDIGETCTNLNLGGDNIFYQTENNNTEALILRSKTLLPLTRSSLNASINAGQGFGNFAKNKIYVHEALVEDYKVATNWSQYASCFEPIEGSKYEHYYADGTPIGLGNGFGLLGFYDVGDSSRYEAIENVPSHINSTVESELVVYTSQSSNASNRPSDSGSHVPNVYYDNKYCNSPGALNIYSPTPFLSDYDVITIEYSIALKPTSTINENYISLYTSLANKSSVNGSASTSYINDDTRNFNNFNQRQFIHKIIEIHKDGTIKGYINGVYKINTTRNTSIVQNATFIGVGTDNPSTNSYLGPVAIWNRALTEDEIAEHYQYYVDTAMVGQTAFDSNGNFVGGWISGRPYENITYIDGNHMIDGSGEIADSTSDRVINFLHCENVDAIHIESGVAYNQSLYCYDSNKQFIGTVGLANIPNRLRSIPLNTSFIRFYSRIQENSLGTISIIPYKLDKIDEESTTYELNKAYAFDWGDNVEPLSIMSTYAYCYGAKTLQTSMNARSFIYFYDENKNQLSSTIRQGNYDEITIPEGTYYLRIHPNSNAINANPWIMFTS